MSFYTHRDVEILLNNRKLLIDSLQLNQNLDIINPFQVGESASERSSINSHIISQLKLSYFITGQDYLKTFTEINDEANSIITGNLCGISFNQGYLKNYSVTLQPNIPININATIEFYDEGTGTFSPKISSGITNQGLLHLSNVMFTTSSGDSFIDLTSNSINSFSWDYTANLLPSYSYKQTGISRYSADRVAVADKQISCLIECDSSDIVLPYNSQDILVNFLCYNNTNSGINEVFACSGKINKKDFSVSTQNLSKTSLSISQQHLNGKPIINTINYNSYPANNYIYIDSLNSNPNGFLSKDRNFSIINKVMIGDTYIPFGVTAQNGFDRISGQITNEVINGYLTLETSKGVVQYPTPLSFTFTSPAITSISTDTGSYHDKITINGSNFYRITDVTFNNKSANFKVINNTGSTHSLIAYVPETASPGKISVISSLRNVSGISTNVFYPKILIDNFSPITGIWNQLITLSGQNFSGITNLYFNGIPSPSFKVINHNLLTGLTPTYGAGYAKGYITMAGKNGMIGKSNYIYHPEFPITGMSTISGTVTEDLVLKVINADTDYLFQDGAGYRVKFGNSAYSSFVKLDSVTFSGDLPTGYIKPPIYVSFYEPDGVSNYKSFATGFDLIGPAPVINASNIVFIDLLDFSIKYYADTSPSLVRMYKPTNLIIKGQNFKDFFGIPWAISISGSGLYQTLSPIVTHANDTIIFSGLRITGAPSIMYGNYTVNVRNYVGTSNTSYLLVRPPINQASIGTISHVRSNASVNTTEDYPAIYAIDGNIETRSAHAVYSDTIGTIGTKFSFLPNNITLSRLEFYQDNIQDNYLGIYPRSAGVINYNNTSHLETITTMRFGSATVYQQPNNISIYNNLYFSGGTLDINPPITGVTGILISGYPSVSNNWNGLTFTEINIY